MGWACCAYRWGEGLYRFLVGKPEGRRPLRRPRRRWVDNIRLDLQEMGWGYMGWIGLAQDRDRWWPLASALMNLGIPWNEGNFLTSCKPVSCSRRTLHHGVSKEVYKIKLHVSAIMLLCSCIWYTHTTALYYWANTTWITNFKILSASSVVENYQIYLNFFENILFIPPKNAHL
jgi:hypothetical protein